MGRFDLSGLFAAVDSEREDRDLSWAALARLVGVSAGTIRRFGEADDAEADGVLALVRWLGMAPEDYVNGGSVKGELLDGPDNVCVRVDMELVASAEGNPSGARGRSRTTIQRLVATAEGSGRSVASLTRMSEV